MSDNENIKNAEKELEYLTGDEEIRRLAYLREKAIRDEAAAIKKAKREGREEEKKIIAKKMYTDGVDIKIISKATELTEEEIKNL